MYISLFANICSISDLKLHFYSHFENKLTFFQFFYTNEKLILKIKNSTDYAYKFNLM